jgi:Type IV secretory pathway, VirD2 components (relaxase)
MAVTWLRPLHINKGKSVSQTITERTDYAENPDKTRKGELVTGYECSPRTVDAEFLLAKQQYAEINGRDQGDKNILAYHIRQSFKPGEITPEVANKLGYELAIRFTKGKHAFIVATHVDKKHIHNHIVFDSVNLECNHKFMNFWNSSRAVRRVSDQICLENMLSVIQEPKPRKGHYGTWLGDQKTESWRSKLQSVINRILNDKPADFETFLKLLEAAGVEVKLGKHISLKMTGQKSFIRLRSLSSEYSEEAIRESILGKHQNPKKINLLIDIQNSIKAQNSPAYERWAKVHNRATRSHTITILQSEKLCRQKAI